VSITNFGQLKTASASWTNKTNLSSSLADFVTLAESEIRRDVETLQQDLRTTGTLTGETLSFPGRTIEVRSLTVEDQPLEYLTPEAYQRKTDQEYTEQGYYTLIGRTIYVLNGASGDDYVLLYTEHFTGFSDDSDTNWLLTNAPDVYLWASCKQAAIFLKDVAAATGYDTLYKNAVASLNAQERRAKFSGGPLIVRPEVVE